MKNPAHPGGFVKTEIIEQLELFVTEAARVLGIPRGALSAFLNERAFAARTTIGRGCRPRPPLGAGSSSA
jgi:plasmid maintenance system antidote protein VapI